MRKKSLVLVYACHAVHFVRMQRGYEQRGIERTKIKYRLRCCVLLFNVRCARLCTPSGAIHSMRQCPYTVCANVRGFHRMFHSVYNTLEHSRPLSGILSLRGPRLAPSVPMGKSGSHSRNAAGMLSRFSIQWNNAYLLM